MHQLTTNLNKQKTTESQTFGAQKSPLIEIASINFHYDEGEKERVGDRVEQYEQLIIHEWSIINALAVQLVDYRIWLEAKQIKINMKINCYARL